MALAARAAGWGSPWRPFHESTGSGRCSETPIRGSSRSASFSMHAPWRSVECCA